MAVPRGGPALLGPFPEGRLGGETEDVLVALHAGGQEDHRVVQGSSPSSSSGAARDSEPETARSLRLLRNHR
jgi:hypothetical protein